MNQKGFINILLIVIIVALAGAGAYFVATRQVIPPAPSPTPTSTPSLTSAPIQGKKTETGNWRTYENEQYKFRLRYPSTWKTEQKYTSAEWDLAPYSETFISPDFRIVDQTNVEVAYDPPPIKEGGKLQLMLTAVSHRESMSFEQYRREGAPNAQVREINNLKFLFSKLEYPTNSRTFEARFIYPFSPDGTTYLFSVRLETSQSEEKLHEDIFNNILASFDFAR
jgi:hypothetical protein